MKYRSKPKIVDAEQWLGSQESWLKILEMGLEDWDPGELGSYTFYIKTLEGDMIASAGDWIIKGIKGEFYPCKPDIFEASYEPV